MDDRPVCGCHGEPMRRSGQKRGKQLWRCHVKQNAAMRRYRATEKGREAERRYRATEKGKARDARYAATPARRSSRLLYELGRVRVS